jgi:uncharacterized membrane protein YiaA
MRFKVGAYEEKKSEDICWRILLTPVSGTMGRILNVVLDIVLNFVAPVTLLASLFGFALLSIPVLAAAAIFDPSEFVRHHSQYVIPAIGIFAIEAGVCLRLILIYYAEMKHSRVGDIPALIQLVQSAGFLVGLYYCTPWLRTYGTLIAILAFCTGIGIASCYSIGSRTYRNKRATQRDIARLRGQPVAPA